MPWFDRLLRPELAEITAYRPAPVPPGAARLDANESPYALDPAARRHLAEALAAVDLHRYPDVRATRLRALIAERAGAQDPDQVVLGCGSDEVIALLVSALSRPAPGRARAAAVFPDPSFVMFRVATLAAGLEPLAVPLDAAWDLDAPAMVAAIDAHAPSVVFIPSPNNPTGTLFDAARIEAVIEAARGRSLVVLDEAYGAFSGRSYADLRAANAHVAQLQTLSKVGLAAARVGWAVLDPDLAREVDKVRQPYNLNALSQRAAEVFLTDLRAEVDRAIARIVADRETLATAAARIPGVRVAPSAANFLWLELPRDAAGVYHALYDRGVLVRSFHRSGGRAARCLRVTVGSPDENARLLDALRAVL